MSENASNEDYLLWNSNYYRYQLQVRTKVDCFVNIRIGEGVLEGQFAQYSQHRPRIVTIPVGSMIS